VRIFDAILVETDKVPADPTPILELMARAANERIELMWPAADGCDFEKTPLSFTCVALVLPDLAAYVLEQTGSTLDEVAREPNLATGKDVAFWKAFAKTMVDRLCKDRRGNLYYRNNEVIFCARSFCTHFCTHFFAPRRTSCGCSWQRGTPAFPCRSLTTSPTSATSASRKTRISRLVFFVSLFFKPQP
jgi:hypothetical protein